MTRSLKLDDELVRNAEAITGLSDTAAVEEALRHFIEYQERATFETLAAQFRALTTRRKHTPSEILLREERDGHAY